MNISKNLLEKYNYPVPRYTSYPPANYFWELSWESYLKLVEESNKDWLSHISIYIHIPFCKQLCYYCWCNMSVYNSEKIVEHYFEALINEINLVLPNIDKTRKLAQIHYGWWTPNFVNLKYLEKINKIFFDNFTCIENAEIAIESHPAFLDEKAIDWIIKAWFNRVSIWIQDFNTHVLKNINRLAPVISIEKIVSLFRSKKKDISINFDFIYWLPGQSIDSFKETISKAIELKPNRLVTFSYAHVPSIKLHQKILESKWLPKAEEKSAMFQVSRELLIEAWYVPIWLDHYVLKDDQLNKAFESHALHRNFQWYCTRETTGQVYAFWVSAISQLDSWFAQNTKDLKEYIDLLQDSKMATKTWLKLSLNQKIVWEIIEQLMCNYYLDFSLIAKKFDVSIEGLFDMLRINDDTFDDMQNDWLLKYQKGVIIVTEEWKFFIRNISALVDPDFSDKKVFSKWI